MATHSSILTWRIPWTEEPCGHSPWGHKELDTNEQLTLPYLRNCMRGALVCACVCGCGCMCVLGEFIFILSPPFLKPDFNMWHFAFRLFASPC